MNLYFDVIDIRAVKGEITLSTSAKVDSNSWDEDLMEELQLQTLHSFVKAVFYETETRRTPTSNVVLL